MTNSIGTLWGTPPVQAAPPADTSTAGRDAGTSFKAIAERLAKIDAPEDEAPAPEEIVLAAAAVPIPLSPAVPEWTLPNGAAGAGGIVADQAAGTVPSPQPSVLQAPLPAFVPGTPFPDAGADPGLVAAPPQAGAPEPVAGAPALPADRRGGPIELPPDAQPGVQTTPQTAPLPEPLPHPAPNTPAVPAAHEAVAATAPHTGGTPPGGLTVSGMHAAQEALLRPVGTPAPRIAEPDPVTASPALPGDVPGVAGTDRRMPRNQDIALAARRAVRRAQFATTPAPAGRAPAAGERSAVAAVAPRDSHRSAGDTLVPFAGDENRTPAASASSESRFALGLATATGSREMQFQTATAVPASQVPAMIAAQERVAAEMAALVRAGGGEARLDLEPAELGKLRLRLAVRNRVVEGSITVENPAVKAALESNMQGLVVALERTGLGFDRIDVRLVDSRRGQERRENRRDADTGRREERDTGDAPTAARPNGRRGAGSGLVDYWF